MKETISVLFLYLIIYSFLGWLTETIYCSFLSRHYVERGFLNGPICPIYGFGALFVLSVLNPYTDSILTVFILGMISTSVLEYITSYLMEKTFKMKWWDYSEHRFNIKGRICLLNSVLFGILCVILTELLNPLVTSLVKGIPFKLKHVLAIILFIILVVDLIASVRSVVNLKDKFERIHLLKDQLRELLEQETLTKKLVNLHESRSSLIENMLDDFKGLKGNLTNVKKNMDLDKLKLSLYEKLGSMQTENRILRSFPKLKSIKHNETFQEIQKFIKEFREDYERNKKDLEC